VFAVLEITFLVPRQGLAEGLGDDLAQLGRCPKREKQKAIAVAAHCQ
jgi:hypothetical protein